MAILMIKGNTGININNVTSDIFQYSKGMQQIGSDLVIDIDSAHIDEVADIIENQYSSHADGALVLSGGEGDTFYINVAPQEAPQEEVAPAREMDEGPYVAVQGLPPQPEEPVRERGLDMGRTHPVPPQRTDPVPLQRTHPVPPPGNIAITVRRRGPILREDDGPRNNEEDDYSEEAVIKEYSTLLPAHQKADTGIVSVILAKAMRNQMASASNILFERIAELSKLSSRMIVLQNEIETLSKPINANPQIEKILAQINQLNSEDNLLEEVYVDVTGNIVLLTKNMITEVLNNGNRYDLGKYEILINSNILLCELSSGQIPHDLIKIKNRTRHIEYGGEAWDGGHIIHGGDVCFGKAFEQLFTAFSKKDIVMASEILIRFIKNPDLDDGWGCHAKYFPLYHEQVEVAAAQ